MTAVPHRKATEVVSGFAKSHSLPFSSNRLHTIKGTESMGALVDDDLVIASDASAFCAKQSR